VITATRPTAAALKSVLAWADRIAEDLQELLGYRLEATAHHVRLTRPGLRRPAAEPYLSYRIRPSWRRR